MNSRKSLHSRENLHSRKSLHFGILCILFGIIAAMLASFLRNCDVTEKKRQLWELDKAMVYDEQMKKMLEEMQAGNLMCVFWTRKNKADVENVDFARSVQVKAIGIAGSSAILFPDANVLCSGETGYCILGADTAYELFGSTDILGRSVKIEEETYQVAGIEYDRKKLIIYQLSPAKQTQVDYVAYQYENRKLRNMTEQRLQNAYHIFGTAAGFD